MGLMCVVFCIIIIIKKKLGGDKGLVVILSTNRY